MVPDRLFVDEPVPAIEVICQAFFERDIERAGNSEQRLSGPGVEVGGIDNTQTPAGHSQSGDVMQQAESLGGDALIALIIADHGPAIIR